MDTLDGEYETVGDYDTGYDEAFAAGAAAANPNSPAARAAAQRAAAARAAAARAAAARAAAARNALARGGPPQGGYAAPGGGAAAEARIRAIVLEELSRRVPYGDVPPRPNADEAMFPMGLGEITLTSVNPVLSLISRPQRAFRGERLVLAIERSAGATGIQAQLLNFQIGDYKQLVGGGSLPASVFASDAFGVRLMLDASIPGVLYQLDLRAIVPPGEFIIVSGAVIGRAGEAAQR